MLVAILTTTLSAMAQGLSPLNWLDDFLYLPEVLYVLFFIWLICSGPGKFSVDYWLAGKLLGGSIDEAACCQARARWSLPEFFSRRTGAKSCLTPCRRSRAARYGIVTANPPMKGREMDWKRLVQFALLGSSDLEQYAILLVRVSIGLFFAISGTNKLLVAGGTKPVYDTLVKAKVPFSHQTAYFVSGVEFVAVVLPSVIAKRKCLVLLVGNRREWLVLDYDYVV